MTSNIYKELEDKRMSTKVGKINMKLTFWAVAITAVYFSGLAWAVVDLIK